jgi:hypothetical protein
VGSDEEDTAAQHLFGRAGGSVDSLDGDGNKAEAQEIDTGEEYDISQARAARKELELACHVPARLARASAWRRLLSPGRFRALKAGEGLRAMLSPDKNRKLSDEDEAAARSAAREAEGDLSSSSLSSASGPRRLPTPRKAEVELEDIPELWAREEFPLRPRRWLKEFAYNLLGPLAIPLVNTRICRLDHISNITIHIFHVIAMPFAVVCGTLST